MARLILFLGVQLSGKTTLAKIIAEASDIHFLSIDNVRLVLYSRLSGPQDWSNCDSVLLHNEQTKLAYDVFFKFMEEDLAKGRSLVVEMPHLADRERTLGEIIRKLNIGLKIVWCYISKDTDEEIQKRIARRTRHENLAPIRLEDYRMFKGQIRKPTLFECLEVDTCKRQDICLKAISRYLSV